MTEGTAYRPERPSDQSAQSGETGEASGLTKYCKGCFYALKGLDFVGACPECGRRYDLANAATYSYEPHKPSFFKSARVGWFRLAMLLLIAGVWHVIMQGDWCLTAILYPVWIAVTTAFLLDQIHLLGKAEAGMLSLCYGALVGIGVAAGLGLIYYGDVNTMAMLTGGGFGIVGGVMLIQAEISGMRASA